jgi:hypothetical protein
LAALLTVHGGGVSGRRHSWIDEGRSRAHGTQLRGSVACERGAGPGSAALAGPSSCNGFTPTTMHSSAHIDSDNEQHPSARNPEPIDPPAPLLKFVECAVHGVGVFCRVEAWGRADLTCERQGRERRARSSSKQLASARGDRPLRREEGLRRGEACPLDVPVGVDLRGGSCEARMEGIDRRSFRVYKVFRFRPGTKYPSEYTCRPGRTVEQFRQTRTQEDGLYMDGSVHKT